MSVKQLNFADLRAELADADAAATLLSRIDPAPWYLRLLLGFSGWLTTLLLTAFFGFDLLDSAGGRLAFGTMLLLGSGTVRFFAPRQDFLDQLLLSLSLTGIGLFTFGLAEDSDSSKQTAAMFSAVSFLTFLFFRDYLHRVFSVLGVIGGLLILLILFGLMFENVAVVPFVLVCCALGATALFLLEAKLLGSIAGEYQAPAAVGLALSVAGLVLISVLDQGQSEVPIHFVVDWRWTSLALLGILLAVVAWLFHDGAGAAWQSAAALALLAIPGVLLLSAPGVIAALLLLVLGFYRGNRFIAGLAALTLLGYLFYYYYNLELTLQIKSYILIASGAALLLVRFVVTRYIFPLQSSPRSATGDEQ